MFGYTPQIVRILEEQLTILRAEIARKDDLILDLINKTAFNRRPEHLGHPEPYKVAVSHSDPLPSTDRPQDSYSAALRRAELETEN